MVDEKKAVSQSAELCAQLDGVLSTMKAADPNLDFRKFASVVASCSASKAVLGVCLASEDASAEAGKEAAQSLESAIQRISDYIDSQALSDAVPNFVKVLQDLWLKEGGEIPTLSCRTDEKAMSTIQLVAIRGWMDVSLI